jgi:hypothetical protein
MLVNYAIQIAIDSVARQNPTSLDEDLDVGHHLPRPKDPRPDKWKGMTQVTAAAVFLGVAIAVDRAARAVSRVLNLAGPDFFDRFLK